MILHFDRAVIERLLAHSASATERRPSIDQLFDRQFRKPGAPYKEWAGEEHIDRTKIPAGLWLVGDDGIYFLSNGLPLLPREDGKPGTLPAYAREANPTIDPDHAYAVKSRAFGEDDGCEFLPEEAIRAALAAARGDTIAVKLTASALQFVN